MSMDCIVCGKQAFYTWTSIAGIDIQRCRSCGVGMTTPVPSAEELLEDNLERYIAAEREKIYLPRIRYFQARYHSYIKEIKKFKKTGALLDIGCNLGIFLLSAQKEGFTVTGVELNKSCAEYGRKRYGLKIHSDYLAEIDFPDETFDVITLYDVLEHVPDIKGMLSDIRRKLKNDGLLVIQSPNIDSVLAQLTKAKWSWLTPPDHLYHFNPSGLASLLISSGFRIEKSRTWEPAEDFCNNVAAAYLPGNIVGRVIQKLLRISRICFVAVLFLQRIWWKRQQGGLIQIYAMKDSRRD